MTGTATALSTINRLVQLFREKHGAAPNVVFLGPNSPIELQGRKEILGMRVVVDDAAQSEYKVALE